MLEMKIGLRDMDKRFRAEGWGGRQPGASLFHEEIRSRTVGLIGYGHIGKEIAKRAAAFDMRIIAIRRSQQDAVAPLDWIGTVDQLDKLLTESDFVVVACDMNEDTIGMIGAPQIAKMKPSSIIINVARGRIIAEEALYNALKNKKISGAVLDVWYNYIGNDRENVSPSNLPFEQLDNVILSAHESASAPEQVERRWKFVAENICRAAEGETRENIVFIGSEEAAN